MPVLEDLETDLRLKLILYHGGLIPADIVARAALDLILTEEA